MLSPTLFQRFGLAMIVAFIALIMLFVIDPITSAPGQLLALHRICGLMVASGAMVISLIIFRKEQELERLRDQLQNQLGLAASELDSCHLQ